MVDQVLGKTKDGWLASLRRSNHKKFIKQLGSKSREPLEILEVESLTKESLIQNCFKTAAPLVIRQGAKDWPCLARWSLDFFFEKYAHIEMINFDDAKSITIGELCKNIQAGGKFTMKFHPLVDFEESLQSDVRWDWFRSMEVGPAAGRNSNLFITGEGGTNLHGANVCNLFVQITGKKTWWIYPPSTMPWLELNPMAYHWASEYKPGLWQTNSPLEKIEYYKVNLYPGDILYNPPYFWHYVHTWEPSIAVAYKWINFAHCMRLSKFLTISPFFCRHSTLKGLLAKKATHSDQIKFVETFYKWRNS